MTVFAVVPHAFYWGHSNGFLQQTYALAVTLRAVTATHAQEVRGEPS